MRQLTITQHPQSNQIPLFTMVLVIFLLSILVGGCTPTGISKQLPDSVLEQIETKDYQQRQIDEYAITRQIVKTSAVLPRWSDLRPPLSPGDRLKVSVHNGEDFSGLFEVDIDGTINIPYLPSLQVAGNGVEDAKETICAALVAARLFRPERVWVSARVQQWAPVQVHVSGAVFNSGMVTVNVRNSEERAQKSTQDSGDFPPDRMLPAALRTAGGVRPDAAVDRIILIRNGKKQIINLAGIIDGVPIPHVPLMTGDSIVVPTTGRMSRKLLVPSVITTPGIRIFLSNLTVPAEGNAISAIGKNATSLPYGSRLINALTSANCFGGTQTTNASRHAVLVRTNPLNDKQEVETRSFQELLTAPDNEKINVFLMPNDSIGCYDSGFTNIRDIAKMIYELVLPFSLF